VSFRRNRRLAFAAAALLALATSLGSTRTEAARRRTKPPTEPPVTANEYRPAELADAVRVAALPIATSASAILGVPACPSGVKRSPTMAAQCLVAFDKTLVPFVVAVGSGGTLTASPVFVVVARVELEREIARANTDAVSCGKSPVVVVPSGSAADCRIGKRAVNAIITRTQTGWTVTTTPNDGKRNSEPPEDTKPSKSPTPPKKKKRK
jgi:hypothetical protein